MVSELVCGKGAEIAQRFSNLLQNEKEFERVADNLKDADELSVARALFVQLVLLGAGGWHWRFMRRFLEFPFLFLAVVENPAEEECDMRKRLRRDFARCMLAACVVWMAHIPASLISSSPSSQTAGSA